jgi:hypothetical protein
MHESTLPIRTPDSEGPYEISFEMDVVEDICRDVEEVARMGALGYFRDACALSKDTLEKHMDAFPIIMEVLRLCYDQGDYEKISTILQGALHNSRWSQEERLAFHLMEVISKASMHGSLTQVFKPEEVGSPPRDFILRTSFEEIEDKDVSAPINSHASIHPDAS